MQCINCKALVSNILSNSYALALSVFMFLESQIQGDSDLPADFDVHSLSMMLLDIYVTKLLDVVSIAQH